MKVAVLFVISISCVMSSYGSSVYPTRLDDPAAVYLTPENFHVQGDGKADDSLAVQAAIDKLQETRGEGIVFIPEGRYRITRTIYLWPGIRIIGYPPAYSLGKRPRASRVRCQSRQM